MVGKFRAKDRANYNLCAVNQNLSSGGESNITSDTMVQNLRGKFPHFSWRAHEDKTISNGRVLVKKMIGSKWLFLAPLFPIK